MDECIETNLGQSILSGTGHNQFRWDADKREATEVKVCVFYVCVFAP